MNYIILSEQAGQTIRNSYGRLVADYGYMGNLDSYIDNLLSFDGHFKLFNRCMEKKEYQLIGKKCRLSMEVDRKYSNWFYARRIVYFDTDREYFAKLSQTVELPGEWSVVMFRESFGLLETGTIDISALLNGLKASQREFYDFEGKWSTWDLYNSKLKELEEKRETESERYVQKVILENNIFTLFLNEMSKYYTEDAAVCVLPEGQSRFMYLGRVANIRGTEVEIPCEDCSFVMDYNEKKIGKILKARVIDFGTKARLNRQSNAMKTLFLEEAANSNLKDIISGNFSWTTETNDEVSMEDTAGLFGSNIRQKEAYMKAINAPDVFMIQGPPGTGKTTIITELVRHAIGKGKRVLVSSETNIAVDNVLEKIGYRENVVPVRLGREERIEESCRKYMPEALVDTILEEARGQNSFWDAHGINQQALLDACARTWKQKEALIAAEIKRLTGQVGLNYDYSKLLSKIMKFEKLVLEMNEQHDRIHLEEKAYFSEKKRLSALAVQKAGVEEQLLLLSDDSMASGFHKNAGNNDVRKKSLQAELDGILARISKCQQRLSVNRYEVLAASYNRKMRRYERSRADLAEILPPCDSIMAKAHRIRETLEDIVTLEKQTERLRIAMEEEIRAVQEECIHREQLWEISKDIRAEWIQATRERDVREEIEKIYMSRTNVVFATCTGIAAADNGHFADMEYDYVIIDEAAKCNMLDLLIPLTMGKKIVLVGDHKQLYPMIETEGIKDELTEEQIKELREHILFKWLYEENIPKEFKIMLNRQYRMEKTISEFVSGRFYDGNLICEKELAHSPSMVWIDCDGSEEIGNGTSFQNPKEAKVIEALLMRLDEEYNRGISVGIICTYKAQANDIKNAIKKKEWNNISVECSTVDAFQGKEKHTIIFNIVRSAGVTSFMKDENRVNVAVSRAQEFLYVVGKAELVKNARAGVLKDLYEYIRIHGDLRNSRYVR